MHLAYKPDLLVVNGFPDDTGHDVDSPMPDVPMPSNRKGHFSLPLSGSIAIEAAIGNASTCCARRPRVVITSAGQ